MSFKGGKHHSSLSSLHEYGGEDDNTAAWEEAQPPVRFSVSNPPPSLADYPSGGIGKGRGKKAAGSASQKVGGKITKKLGAGKDNGPKVQQLPPMDFYAAEKKMEELSKLAAGNRALQHAAMFGGGEAGELENRPGGGGGKRRGQGTGGQGLANSSIGAISVDEDNASLASAMSGTEAEFLMRQINSAADLSQLSLLTNPDEFDAVSMGMGGGIPPPHTLNGSAGNVNGGHGMSNATLPILGGPSSRTVSPGTGLSNKAVLPLPRSAGQTDAQGQAKGLGQTNAPSAGQGEPQQQVFANPTAVVTEALKGKIQSLERQIVSLNAIIQKKESELDKRDNKVKNLQVEVERVKLESMNELKRQQSEVSQLLSR